MLKIQQPIPAILLIYQQSASPEPLVQSPHHEISAIKKDATPRQSIIARGMDCA